PSSHLLMEPAVGSELDRIGHVLLHTSPRSDSAKSLEVLIQPLVERASNAFSLMLWVDPDVEPELLRMIHPGHMLALSEPDWFFAVFRHTRVSFEMELRLVKTLVFKLPFLRRPVIVWKDQAEDVGQLPVVISLEFADLQWECGHL